MVKKLAEGGVEDEMVLNALLAVERHQFLDSALANQAYEDTSLPIGFGQTISKPNVVARMIELLRQGKNLKITGEIGACFRNWNGLRLPSSFVKPCFSRGLQHRAHQGFV